MQLENVELRLREITSRLKKFAEGQKASQLFLASFYDLPTENYRYEPLLDLVYELEEIIGEQV